jgi:hypothetical protein
LIKFGYIPRDGLVLKPWGDLEIPKPGETLAGHVDYSQYANTPSTSQTEDQVLVLEFEGDARGKKTAIDRCVFHILARGSAVLIMIQIYIWTPTCTFSCGDEGLG